MHLIDETQADLYLLFSEARSHSYYIHHVALDDANVGKVAPSKGIEILSFALFLLPLECKLLVTGELEVRRRITEMRGNNSLLFVHGLELDNVIGIFTTACRASPVQVFLDVVPAKTTNLPRCSALAPTSTSILLTW